MTNPNSYAGTAGSVIPSASNLIAILSGNSQAAQSIPALGGNPAPLSAVPTTTYIPFAPSASSNFTFQATLDDSSYNIIVNWNLFGERYYINIYDAFQNLIVCLPLIGSPNNYDISLTAGYFKTFLVYRVSTHNFEIFNTANTYPATVSNLFPRSNPLAPTIGIAGAGYNQASVTFTPPIFDGNSPITSYTVTSYPGGITATGISSPILITGLTAGTPYTFTVHATNAIGNSPESAHSNSIIPGPPLFDVSSFDQTLWS